MSDTSEELPKAQSGFGVVTFLRFLAIALGVMSAMLLARDGLKVELSDFLDNVLNVYNGGVEYVALLILGPAITAALAVLREWFDWPLQLYPHWKHVTVLLWLYLGAGVRYQDEYEGPHVLNWILAAALAIVFGVAAGVVPLSQPGVYWWAAACLLLFQAAAAASRAAFTRLPTHPTWWGQFSIMGFPALLLGLWCVVEGVRGNMPVATGRWFLPFAVYSAYLLLLSLNFHWSNIIGAAIRAALLVALVIGIPSDIAHLIQTASSPGLAALVALGVAQGFGGLIEGLIAPNGRRRGLSNDVTQTAIDKLAVLGGAALIVWLSNTMG